MTEQALWLTAATCSPRAKEQQTPYQARTEMTQDLNTKMTTMLLLSTSACQGTDLACNMPIAQQPYARQAISCASAVALFAIHITSMSQRSQDVVKAALQYFLHLLDWH